MTGKETRFERYSRLRKSGASRSLATTICCDKTTRAFATHYFLNKVAEQRRLVLLRRGVARIALKHRALELLDYARKMRGAESHRFDVDF